MNFKSHSGEQQRRRAAWANDWQHTRAQLAKEAKAARRQRFQRGALFVLALLFIAFVIL